MLYPFVITTADGENSATKFLATWVCWLDVLL